MLHESTQRRICRLAFLLGCVLPTLAIFTAVANVWLPSYTRSWETQIGQVLNCRATIDRLHSPTPGAMHFDRLVLSDPETGARWVALNNVILSTYRGQTQLSLARAEISGSAGTEIGECLERYLRGNETSQVAISIDRFVWSTAGESIDLSNIRMLIAAGETGSRMQFWTAESEPGPRLLVERNRQLDPPTTRMVLHTGSQPLPCGVLRAWDSSNQLGERSRFQGRLEIFATRDFVRGTLSGAITQHDLSDQALASHLPARIVVNDLAWHAGRFASPYGRHQTSPVGALLTQLQVSERLLPKNETPFWGPTGDIEWELAPLDLLLRSEKVAVQGDRFFE